MKQQNLSLESFDIIGIKVRTTNAEEMKGAGKISSLWNRFYSEQIAEKIPNKMDSNVLGVYFDYESDANGPYSLLVGIKVAPGTKPPEQMERLQIPQQSYTLFTSEKGEMPGIIMKTWATVWDLASRSLLQRKYSYDFELYDHRAANPQSAEADLYIAIQDG